MFLQILFILISLCGGGVIWYWAAYMAHGNNDIYFKLFTLPYPLFKKFFQHSPSTYFIIISLIIAFIIWIACELIYFSSREKTLTSRGSARWASKKDIKDLIKSDTGVPVGKFNGKILHVDKTHLITCAPTRSGKGVSQIIPTLLEYPDSLVCLDIKGENYAVTANERRKFSKVFALNPFNVLNIPTASYNWLDSIKITETDCITKAGKMASMIVGRSGYSGESHFEEQAIRLLQGVILYVCCEEDKTKRNICTVKELIHTIPLDDLCNEMAKIDDAAFGEIASIGLQFLNNTNEREKGSILSTAQRATNFLGDPNIKKTLIKSDFDISQLPNKLMSIYLIMRQDQVAEFPAYIRVFFDLALSSLILNEGKKKYEVLFLLDEVAQLGYMKNLLNAVSILRGLGGQLWFFFQSLDQMRSKYGKDSGTLLSNSAQIFFGTNDIETMELISKSLGDKTIKEVDEKSQKNPNIIRRELLKPDEVRLLDKDQAIILMSGKPPIKVKKVSYLKDRQYRGLFDKNPYF